jgi:hypothetical protein
MKFAYIRSSDPYVTDQTGARLEPGTRCESHDEPAVFIALYGDRPAAHRFDVLVPRCVLAELVGTITAQILHEEGETALADFRDQVDARVRALAAPLREIREAARDCCEAGYRTSGAEHTCGRER